MGTISVKFRQVERVQFAPDIAPDLRRETERAIKEGRYRIYAPRPDGRAVFLLNTTPLLVAIVLRRQEPDAGMPDMVVEMVRHSRFSREELMADSMPLEDIIDGK
jgi:hypothetical protein